MRLRPESSESTNLGPALFYALGMGWPVVPLTHPVLSPSVVAASKEVATVTAWWTKTAHNVGIPTGECVDAIEVSGEVGAAVLDSWRAQGSRLGPVLRLGDRYQFLIRPKPSSWVCRAFDALGQSSPQLKLRYLGTGDVLVVPPSILPDQTVRWMIEPDLAVRELPAALTMLPMLVWAASWRSRDLTARAFTAGRGYR